MSISKLTRLRPPSASPNPLNYGLQVRTIMASKFISKPARSQPPSDLQTRSIMASRCISKLARSRCWSASLSSLDHDVVKRWSYKADSPSSTFHRTSHHLKWFFQKVRFWLEERNIGVRRYDTTLAWGSTQLRGSPKSWKERVRSKDGKDRVCISYNAISFYSRVSQIYTSCLWVHLHYPCISICMYIERLRWYMPDYDIANLVTVTKTNMINKMLCGCGNLRTTAVRIWHQVSHRACAEVSAALKVSCRPAHRSQ